MNHYPDDCTLAALVRVVAPAEEATGGEGDRGDRTALDAVQEAMDRRN